MKILAFFLLIGLASASLQDLVDDDSDEFIQNFLEEMERTPSLQEHLEFLAETADEDVKTELGRTLKEGLHKVLQKIKEAVEEGKAVKEEFFQKLKDLRDRMKSLKMELGDKSKELLEQIKDRAKDYIKNLLEKMEIRKRASEDRLAEALGEINWKDMLKKIKEHLKKTVDPELLKEKIEKIFGQGTELLEQLLKTLKEKGKKKLMILLDHLLGDDEEERDRRGIKDYWEKVKNYFKDLKIDLQEKYMKFGEWVKNVIDKGMEHSKDKMENIKAIAKEFGKHAKNVSKEIAEEAKEFFRQYKDDLGNIWEELKETFKEIKNRKD